MVLVGSRWVAKGPGDLRNRMRMMVMISGDPPKSEKNGPFFWWVFERNRMRMMVMISGDPPKSEKNNPKALSIFFWILVHSFFFNLFSDSVSRPISSDFGKVLGLTNGPKTDCLAIWGVVCFLTRFLTNLVGFGMNSER